VSFVSPLPIKPPEKAEVARQGCFFCKMREVRQKMGPATAERFILPGNVL
jgi:hypothetical protein